MTDVLTVITNYRRPHNISRIVQAVREQTVPSTVIVVDNSPRGSEPLCVEADHVVAFRNEYGIPGRWLAGMLDLRHRYTLFLDDDLIPGNRAIECCVRTAESLGDMFATLGTTGRCYRRPEDRYEYNRHNVRRSACPVQVDLTCRANFALTRELWRAVKLRNEVLAIADVQDWTLIHDDILLCHGLQQQQVAAPSYLLPVWDGTECLSRTNLRDALGVSGSVSHTEDRTQLINLTATCGWTSLR